MIRVMFLVFCVVLGGCCCETFAQGSSGGMGSRVVVQSTTWQTSHELVNFYGSTGGSQLATVSTFRRPATGGEMRRALRSTRARAIRTALFFAR